MNAVEIVQDASEDRGGVEPRLIKYRPAVEGPGRGGYVDAPVVTDTIDQAQAYAKQHENEGAWTIRQVELPRPVKHESRSCFAIDWYGTEADAELVDAYVTWRGETYNGGFYDGMPCGREPDWDLAQESLFAVTRR